MAKIALGQSDVSFEKRDKRLADEVWRTVPYFRVLGQSYRLFEMWMERMYLQVDGSWQNKVRARFAADVIAAALAPTNYLGTNPAALRKAVETSGMSLGHVVQNMLDDMARGGMPAAADRKKFVVGQDISCTPGPWCTGTRCSSCCSTRPPHPRCAAFRW
jgi:polyhydroxyalkanoate synthase subunit PhaC